jgi:hypothetical protein
MLVKQDGLVLAVGLLIALASKPTLVEESPCV